MRFGLSWTLLVFLLLADEERSDAQIFSNEYYVATMESAKTNLPTAVEFEKQFDNVDHFVVHFGFHGDGVYEWQ